MTSLGDGQRDARRAPSWRTLLGATTPKPAGLALGIELRARPAQRFDTWGPSALRAATPRELSGEHGEVLLAVRPLVRSESTGRWVQADVSWDGIRRSVDRYAVNKVRWFIDFLSIARDSLLSGTAGDWIPLDRVESPLLWQHLAALVPLGIPLVATQKHTSVRLAGAASVGLHLDPLDDGGLTLAPRVAIDGEPAVAGEVRTIGHIGVYHWQVVRTALEVTVAPVTLSAPVHAAIRAATAITIPAEDAEEFFADSYPILARQTEVTAPSRLALPAPPAPEPVLTVAFRSGHRVSYRFTWEYRGHGGVDLDTGDEAHRDAEAETQERRRLETLWSGVTEHPFAARADLEGVDAAEWAARVLPAFEDSAVRTVITGRRKAYRELTGIPEITVTTMETTDHDWFDLGVLVTIDGRTIPFEPLFTALSMRRTKLLLVDGSYLSLAHPGLQRLRDLLDEAVGLAEWDTGPRIHRQQTALWEEFEDLADQAEPAVSWRATVQGLADVDAVPPVAAPEGLQAQLRPYQQHGLDWLAFLWEHRLGGILADDMGLGKTLQILALIQHARNAGERRPFLVIAPTSVLSTWRREAQTFVPGLRTVVIDATAARRTASVTDAAAGADVVITSFTLLRLEPEEYRARAWAGVILDEAQFVKNPATQVHRAIADLDATVTIAVTGTPLENSLVDLWALLALTAPGLFPSARRFREEYVQPIEQGKVPENAEGGEYRARRLARLRRRIRPLVLRRTKQLVAAELPEKQVQEVLVELSPEHQAHYDTVLQRERQKLLGLLADLDRNRFIVFRSLTMLRMLALSPALIDASAGAMSAKLDVLVEHLQELRAEGHRALVFSQFTSYLSLAAERLDAAGIRHSWLDGSTRRREEVIDGFREGDDTVFLISLKAGGFGLTLTEADYVFLLDPWWNPAAEEQAIDRTHRIGQTERVNVYRLIAAGTIEEKVLALQQRKARLFTAVMDDDEMLAQALTADDIRGLLERDAP